MQCNTGKLKVQCCEGPVSPFFLVVSGSDECSLLTAVSS